MHQWNPPKFSSEITWSKEFFQRRTQRNNKAETRLRANTIMQHYPWPTFSDSIELNSCSKVNNTYVANQKKKIIPRKLNVILFVVYDCKFVFSFFVLVEYWRHLIFLFCFVFCLVFCFVSGLCLVSRSSHICVLL